MKESRDIRYCIIASLERTLRETTEETQENACRTWILAKTIGAALSLSFEELHNLKLLADFHDIGKTGIPGAILSKNGPLSSEEWKLMRRHSVIGYNIAMSSPDLMPVAEAILHRHERWDGSGYPHGLSKTEILRLSRIIAVAEAFDVIITGRSYKGPRTSEEALEELARCAGRQFDPEIVRVFLKIADF